MEIIETSMFTRQVLAHLSGAEATSPRGSFVNCAPVWAMSEALEEPMKKAAFEELLASVAEMQEIRAGRLAPSRVTTLDDILRKPGVARLREHFQMSQSQFAALLGISVSTLQNWEQGRREPDGPAKVLLKVAATHPEALLAVNGPRHEPRTKLQSKQHAKRPAKRRSRRPAA